MAVLANPGAPNIRTQNRKNNLDVMQWQVTPGNLEWNLVPLSIPVDILEGFIILASAAGGGGTVVHVVDPTSLREVFTIQVVHAPVAGIVAENYQSCPIAGFTNAIDNAAPQAWRAEVEPLRPVHVRGGDLVRFIMPPAEDTAVTTATLTMQLYIQVTDYATF